MASTDDVVDLSTLGAVDEESITTENGVMNYSSSLNATSESEVVEVAALSTIADGATAANNGGITVIGYTPSNIISGSEVIEVAELITIAGGKTVVNSGNIMAIGYTPSNTISGSEVTDVTALNDILGTV